MNHMLVAELLVEEAKLRDIAAERLVAKNCHDDDSVQKAELLWLKHNNMRDLIWAEMGNAERELYQLLLDHASGLRPAVKS